MIKTVISFFFVMLLYVAGFAQVNFSLPDTYTKNKALQTDTIGVNNTRVKQTKQDSTEMIAIDVMVCPVTVKISSSDFSTLDSSDISHMPSHDINYIQYYFPIR